VQWQRRRDRLAARYDARLADIPGIALPHRPATGTGQHAWHHYPLRIEGKGGVRDAVVTSLRAAGLHTGEPLVPIHLLGYARDVCEMPSRLSGAERFVAETVFLPLYPRLPDDTALRVGEVLTELLGGAPDGALQQG
jgi:dTDP-4-amino-4,6-dideoxygalactose transaminase